jgi:hypothetical protein
VGFVVDKVALRQVFSEYFGLPRQFSFHRLLHNHHHHHHHQLSSAVGTIGQLVADVPSGLSLTPPQEEEKNPLIPELIGDTNMYKTQKNTHTHKHPTSMPRVGFEHTIPASERAKTVHALNCSVTVTGLSVII